MSTATHIPVTTSANGATLVSPARARALALALAMGIHPWAREGGDPLALPDDPKTLGGAISAADSAAADGYFASHNGDDGDTDSFWRPDVSTDGDEVVWFPFTGGQRSGRFIRIDSDGLIRWGSGTGEPSTFIGGALLAAAGGLQAAGSDVHLRPAMATPSLASVPEVSDADDVEVIRRPAIA